MLFFVRVPAEPFSSVPRTSSPSSPSERSPAGRDLSVLFNRKPFFIFALDRLGGLGVHSSPSSSPPAFRPLRPPGRNSRAPPAGLKPPPRAPRRPLRLPAFSRPRRPALVRLPSRPPFFGCTRLPSPFPAFLSPPKNPFKKPPPCSIPPGWPCCRPPPNNFLNCSMAFFCCSGSRDGFFLLPSRPDVFPLAWPSSPSVSPANARKGRQHARTTTTQHA